MGTRIIKFNVVWVNLGLVILGVVHDERGIMKVNMSVD